MVSEQYRWARLITVGGLLALIIVAGGVTACDIRDRVQVQEMAARGFCRAAQGVWIPCVVKP